MSLPDLDQENDLPMSLSLAFDPQTSTPRDFTKEALDSTNPPTHFNHSCEFEEGEEFESAS